MIYQEISKISGKHFLIHLDKWILIIITITISFWKCPFLLYRSFHFIWHRCAAIVFSFPFSFSFIPVFCLNRIFILVSGPNSSVSRAVIFCWHRHFPCCDFPLIGSSVQRDNSRRFVLASDMWSRVSEIENTEDSSAVRIGVVLRR